MVFFTIHFPLNYKKYRPSHNKTLSFCVIYIVNFNVKHLKERTNLILNDDSKVVFFDNLVRNQRTKVVAWLKGKYPSLSLYCEDVFQEAVIAFWEKFRNMEWTGQDVAPMLWTFSRNTATHWLHGVHEEVDWDDHYYPTETQVESDFTFVTPNTYRMMMKETMYEMIDHLAPKDRSLIMMILQGIKQSEIAQRLGFKSAQVVKNKKSKIVVRLREEINAQASNACALFVYISPFLILITHPFTHQPYIPRPRSMSFLRQSLTH